VRFDKTLWFVAGGAKYSFRTLTPEDVTPVYVKALRETRGLIENVPEDVSLKWQQDYVRDILQSPCDTICGLFSDAGLLGTSGIQNVSPGGIANRSIKLAIGSTYNCTFGTLILDKESRGKGYGRILVWSSCYMATKCGGVRVITAGQKKSNIAAIKSVLVCGFKIKEEIPDAINVELQTGELVKPEGISDVTLE